MTKELQKQEAVKRMEMIGLDKVAIDSFKDGIIKVSEGLGYFTGLDDYLWMQILNFEEQFDSIVYHAIRSYTNYGEMIALLHVSKYEEEWEMDRYDIEHNYTFVYVINLTHPEFSEFGSISFENYEGELLRTC